jgi:hypothetical protein
MNIKPVLAAVCASVITMSFSNISGAALFDRGGGLIYDDLQDITWLQDANYADGIMNWDDAQAWAGGLSYYDSVRDVSYDDWRLPITTQPDTSASEMLHLYTVDGVTTSTPGLFINMGNDNYWSSEHATDPSSAWTFRFQNGALTYRGKDSNIFAWAVRPGDVSAVPVPAAAWLFGSGVIGLVGLARRKSA